MVDRVLPVDENRFNDTQLKCTLDRNLPRILHFILQLKRLHRIKSLIEYALRAVYFI